MESLKWQDMLSLPFLTEAYNAVIEEGAMDVSFVDNDSPWDPNPVDLTGFSLISGCQRLMCLLLCSAC